METFFNRYHVDWVWGGVDMGVHERIDKEMMRLMKEEDPERYARIEANLQKFLKQKEIEHGNIL